MSLAPRTFSSGLGLLAPLYMRHQSDLGVCRLETAWNRCLSPPPAGYFLHAPGLGAHPSGGPSLCPHPAGRTDAAPHAGRSLGGTSHPEFHDLPSATVVRLALQEAAPAAPTSPPQRVGNRATGHRQALFPPTMVQELRPEAGPMWPHDVCPDHAVPHPSGAGAATDRAGGDPLGIASRVVSGLWTLEQSPGASRACHRYAPG